MPVLTAAVALVVSPFQQQGRKVMLAIIGVIAVVVGTVIGGTTGVIQVWMWIRKQGYKEGEAAARQAVEQAAQAQFTAAEREARAQVAAELQALRADVQILKELLASSPKPPGTRPGQRDAG
jgi:hypothetical protein